MVHLPRIFSRCAVIQESAFAYIILWDGFQASIRFPVDVHGLPALDGVFEGKKRILFVSTALAQVDTIAIV